MKIVYLNPFKRLLSAAFMRTFYCCNTVKQPRQFIPAFSLVEMLMALLVASLLLAALAPVMTRRMNENITLSGDFKIPDKETVTYEITSDKPEYCDSEIKTDEDGNEYYECHFTVPQDYNGPMQITMISAGGGGGTAPTAGYTEFKEAGSSNTFTVPAMVNKLEATLISGGAGGGAGGQILKSQTFVASGTGNVTQNNNDKLTVLSNGIGAWSVPEIARNKNVLVTACGGGGGGGGSPGSGNVCGKENSQHFSSVAAGYGGGGGYILNSSVSVNNALSLDIIIGGGGGGGGAGGGSGGGVSAAMGLNGKLGGGGGGGGDQWCNSSGAGGGGGSTGGNGGDLRACDVVLGLGGQRGDVSLSANTNGADGVLGSNAKGGVGTSAMSTSVNTSAGGDSVWGNPETARMLGGGGGGGSSTGYGGGGGGGGSSAAGGGGGGGATILGSRNNPLVVAPGGGGGGGASTDDYDYVNNIFVSSANLVYGGGGGGGGGGGIGGGNGGTGGRSRVSHGLSGYNGINYSASTIFGTNYCNGGFALTYGNHLCPQKGGNGQDGAMRISYLSYGPGGSGGGGAQMVPIQPVSNVKPGDVLNIKIGNGQAGGTAGRIENDGTITLPTIGKGESTYPTLYDDYVTEIYKGSETLLSTTKIRKVLGADSRFGYGLYGGSTTGESFSVNQSPYYACQGYITNGVDYSYLNSVYKDKGFSNTDGYNADDSEGTKIIFLGSKTYPNGSTGGAGGRVVTPWFECTPGKGGTASSPNGGDASGYGCGGGGGYGLADGGKGSGGYARLSWNKFWDTTLGEKGEYKRAEIGSGGGGASGNVMKFSIANVIGGQTYTIRIGKGGRGAYVVNNNIIPAKTGGSTVFELGISDKLKVIGGAGGLSTTVKGNEIENGAGGSVPNSRICFYNTSDYTKKSTYCIKGTEGNTSDNANGGNGGAMAAYGTGGSGGVQDTGDRSKGGAGTGIASGGGGAAIREITGSVNTGDVLNNPNEGGSGTNGKVIIQILRSAM